VSAQRRSCLSPETAIPTLNGSSPDPSPWAGLVRVEPIWNIRLFVGWGERGGQTTQRNLVLRHGAGGEAGQDQQTG
jgi:hypothetical protein